MSNPIVSRRGRLATSIAATIALAAGALIGVSTPASATNTAATSAHYGASAAVDVQRTPGYPACSGTTFSQWVVTSTGNPVSQSAINDLGNARINEARVDLSAVSVGGTATEAYLMVVNVGGGSPWALKMYRASDNAEIYWNPTSHGWTTTSTGAQSFAPSGVAYAIYSGGFMHEGVHTGSNWDIGTFLMIDNTLPIGSTLTYTPSPVTDNVCTSLKTTVTTTGMASTSLGGSGAITVPASGSGSSAAPVDTLDFDGNGGTCSPSSVQGIHGYWGSALTAAECTNAGRVLNGFSTSPTLAAGSVFVRPGGPVYFNGSNRLYAIWGYGTPSVPQSVVATPALNSVAVSWQPPASDGGLAIQNYLVLYTSSENATLTEACFINTAVTSETSCTIPLAASNTKYTFSVEASNGWKKSAPAVSAPVSPYAIDNVSASRPNVLLGLGGTKVEARGSAVGLAGQALNADYKVGSATKWTTEANAAKVNDKGEFSWSKKFGLSQNKAPVTIRFTYGTDAVSSTYVLARGAENGDLSAPRNVKAVNEVNRVHVTWDPPKFTGGAKIDGYRVCASYRGTLCRTETKTSGQLRLPENAEYEITVSAVVGKREGPSGKAAHKIKPTTAGVWFTGRDATSITVSYSVAGYKPGSKFRLELAGFVPGTGAKNLSWDPVHSMTISGAISGRRTIRLDPGQAGENLVARLVTPTGTVVSLVSRP